MKIYNYETFSYRFTALHAKYKDSYIVKTMAQFRPGSKYRAAGWQTHFKNKTTHAILSVLHLPTVPLRWMNVVVYITL